MRRPFRCSRRRSSSHRPSRRPTWRWRPASRRPAATADARREYQQYLELAPSAPDADAVRTHLQSLGIRLNPEGAGASRRGGFEPIQSRRHASKLSQRCLIAVLAVSGRRRSVHLFTRSRLATSPAQEEERRKDVKAPAKVNTNKDLGAVPESSSGTLSAARAGTAAPATAAKADDRTTRTRRKTRTPRTRQKDQAYWAGREEGPAGRSSTRDQTLADALQTRINAL